MAITLAAANSSPTLLDCTLRDGGYYNDWDFGPPLVERYLAAMAKAGVDVVELGFRFVSTDGYKGPCAYTTDAFLSELSIPDTLSVGVMVNAAELISADRMEDILAMLFPVPACETVVDLVRVACHAKEFVRALEAAEWLKEKGYQVGFNIMQIADRSQKQILEMTHCAAGRPIDVLYFADSMGSLTPAKTSQIVEWLQAGWSGPLGVHTHDNMGLALSNTLAALEAGVTWVDSTVTGMGRGPGNARTEELVLECAEMRPDRRVAISALLDLVAQDFAPMKAEYGWGSNPFYYQAGKFGIHPTYIQEMLADKRFNADDILTVIEYLRHTDEARKYDISALHSARHMSVMKDSGDWAPASVVSGRDVLILGNGSSVGEHRVAIERFIDSRKPLVMGLNSVSNIDSKLIDVRLACHPLRLLADAHEHSEQQQPLITPAKLLSDELAAQLREKKIFNYGLSIDDARFEARERNCELPARLVAAYAMAVAIAGKANHIYMAGFDGFTAEDPRYSEMREVLELCLAHDAVPPVTSITKTRYPMLPTHSVYGLVR